MVAHRNILMAIQQPNLGICQREGVEYVQNDSTPVLTRKNRSHIPTSPHLPDGSGLGLTPRIAIWVKPVAGLGPHVAIGGGDRQKITADGYEGLCAWVRV